MVRLRSLIPIALAVLEVIHPAWPDSSVGEAVQPVVAWWVLLHVGLLVGYVLLVVVLWGLARSVLARWMLLAFAACNTAYLALDGVGVGLLARSDPVTADRLWGAVPVTVLADLVGATWAAALLLIAIWLQPSNGRVVRVGSGVAWLALVASAVTTGAIFSLLSRGVALATGAWSVYQDGSRNLPVALLIFASVLRQHVGPEAAVGLIGVALALALTPARGSPTERSDPVAACQP